MLYSISETLSITINEPNIKTLFHGWQLLSTEWIAYWVDKVNPINNRCIHLPRFIENKGISFTEMVYSQGTKEPSITILDKEQRKLFGNCEYSELSCKRIVPELSELYLALRNKEYCKQLISEYVRLGPGFTRLFHEVGKTDMQVIMSGKEGIENQYEWKIENNPLLKHISEKYLGHDRIEFSYQIDNKHIVSGRHRICAAFKYGILFLPVYINLQNLYQELRNN
jgi:hypothetical protein